MERWIELQGSNSLRIRTVQDIFLYTDFFIPLSTIVTYNVSEVRLANIRQPLETDLQLAMARHAV